MKSPIMALILLALISSSEAKISGGKKLVSMSKDGEYVDVDPTVKKSTTVFQQGG